MISIAVIIYSCQRLHIQLPNLINNYVNDLLCVPIVLAITQKLIQLFKKSHNYIISVKVIFFVVFYYSLYFEYILPLYKTRYTGDFIDVVLYILGGMIFYIIERNKRLN